jgi:hypothetical protein
MVAVTWVIMIPGLVKKALGRVEVIAVVTGFQHLRPAMILVLLHHQMVVVVAVVAVVVVAEMEVVM